MELCSEGFQRVWPAATLKCRNKRIVGGLIKWLDTTAEIRTAEWTVFLAYVKEEGIDPIASPAGARFIADFLEAVERTPSLESSIRYK